MAFPVQAIGPTGDSRAGAPPRPGNSGSIEFTATEADIVRFFCNVPGHEQAGMTGRLKVE
jgi:uncharacterized cupredoxin-like copper-binding protein